MTDGNGCSQTDTYLINAPTALVPSVVNVQGVTCASPNGGNIDLDVMGGSPTYIYHWNNGSALQDPQNLATGTYTVTVTDAQGCIKTTTATVPANTTPPVASR